MAVERMSASVFSRFRGKKRKSDKLIIVSCEGSATEWDYFGKVVNSAFANISTKVRVINVEEDILKKRPDLRTSEENTLLSSSSPKNLLDKMDAYIEVNGEDYDFGKHPDDEFWLIMDIDEHTNPSIIDRDGKSNLDKWKDVLQKCKSKNYQYAVSNPLFELWLLMHFDDVNNSDRLCAVTASHPYTPTDHFRKRLAALGAPLRDGKHIRDPEIYTKAAIGHAISRAETLDDPTSGYDYPDNHLGSTVYKLLKSIAEIDAQNETD